MKKAGLRALGTCALGLFVVVVSNACGSSGDGAGAPPPSGLDLGDGGAADGAFAGRCTAGAKECVTTHLARVCPSDGASWLPVECAPGEVCAGGDCVRDPNAACAPGSGTCTDATTGLRCKADGKGYEQVTCPAGTSCTGDGQCAGACVVGESYCVAPGVLATCADGKTLTQTACGGTDLCVATGTSPVRTAACKPAECHPDPGGCDFVCGNALNAAADQTKFMSACEASPDGYKWVAIACASSQSCDPTGGRCNGNRDSMAACRSACTPGDQRCTADGSGYQTCDATGQWSGTATACTATATAAQQVCMPKPGTPGQVVCGDPLCARGYDGVCDATGKIRLCDATGHVAATATSCAAGTCRSVSTQSIGGLVPGACRTDCAAGESECTAPGATSYRTCTSGTWSATTTSCAGNATCVGYTDLLGLRKTVCGVCAPGSHRCQGDQIETCDATGQWGAAATCTVGLCQSTKNGTDAACVAQCVPNAKVCLGGDKAVAGVPYARGKSAEGTCTANGLLPATSTTCAGSTACRVSSTGTALGCVECVGTGVAGGNEYGFTDSRCTDATGAYPGSPPDSATQVCSAANTWPATATTTCGGGTSCSQTQPGYSCQGACPDPFDYGGKCTASGLASNFNGMAVSCSTFGQTAMQCGTTADCCSGECKPTGAPMPAPAYCK